MAEKNQKTAPGKSVQGLRDDRSDLVESDTTDRLDSDVYGQK